MKRSCEDCNFWEYLDGEFGNCRRSAPMVDPTQTPVMDREQTIWPMTRENDWCGEFQRVETIAGEQVFRSPVDIYPLFPSDSPMDAQAVYANLRVVGDLDVTDMSPEFIKGMAAGAKASGVDLMLHHATSQLRPHKAACDCPECRRHGEQ